MADVKFLKLNPDFLDGASFKFMRRAKVDGVADLRDKLESIWFELLGLAGKINNNGKFYNEEIAYNNFDDMAIMLDRTPEELEICMKFYLAHKMVTIIDNCYSLTNWSKYQNVKGLEEIRERNRKRVAKFREKNNTKSICNVTGNVTETLRSITVTPLDIDIDKDIYIDKDKEYKRENNIKEKKCQNVSNGKNIPPSLNEIEEYTKSKHMLVSPEKFYDHYSSTGWYIGRTKMKNWHSALSTWERRIKDQDPAEYQSRVSKLTKPHYLVNGVNYTNANSLIMCEFRKSPKIVVNSLSKDYTEDEIRSMIKYDLKIDIDNDFQPIENDLDKNSINTPNLENVSLDVSKLIKKISD